jgi:hypothetical protein
VADRGPHPLPSSARGRTVQTRGREARGPDDASRLGPSGSRGRSVARLRVRRRLRSDDARRTFGERSVQ